MIWLWFARHIDWPMWWHLIDPHYTCLWNSCFKCEEGEITYDLHTILDVLDIHRGPHIGCEWVSSYLLIRMHYGNTHFNIQLAKCLRVILPIYYWKSTENVGNFLMANFPVWQISIRLTIANYQQKKQVQDLCFLEFCGFSENWSLGFTFYWWRLEQKHTSLLSRSSNCSKLWSAPCLKARLMLSPQLLLKMLPSSTLGRAIRRPPGHNFEHWSQHQIVDFPKQPLIVTHIKMIRPTLGNAQLTCCSGGERLSDTKRGSCRKYETSHNIGLQWGLCDPTPTSAPSIGNPLWLNHRWTRTTFTKVPSW